MLWAQPTASMKVLPPPGHGCYERNELEGDCPGCGHVTRVCGEIASIWQAVETEVWHVNLKLRFLVGTQSYWIRSEFLPLLWATCLLAGMSRKRAPHLLRASSQKALHLERTSSKNQSCNWWGVEGSCLRPWNSSGKWAFPQKCLSTGWKHWRNLFEILRLTALPLPARLL